jgi:hypothetical protein
VKAKDRRFIEYYVVHFIFMMPCTYIPDIMLPPSSRYLEDTDNRIPQNVDKYVTGCTAL